LKSRSWDAVISDYVLPQFSGPEALKLFRHLRFEIPFIMVSGIYGEEAAVDMMKAGASDYILKRNLPAWCPPWNANSSRRRIAAAANARKGR